MSDNWFKRLDTQLHEPSDQNSIQVPIVEKENVIIILWGIV